jgi:hypothetical protein
MLGLEPRASYPGPHSCCITESLALPFLFLSTFLAIIMHCLEKTNFRMVLLLACKNLLGFSFDVLSFGET